MLKRLLSVVALTLVFVLVSMFSFSVVKQPIVQAVSGTVTGVVTDADTGQPLEGAKVALSRHKGSSGARWVAQTETDENGEYFLSFNEPEENVLRITWSKPGYFTILSALRDGNYVLNRVLYPRGGGNK